MATMAKEKSQKPLGERELAVFCDELSILIRAGVHLQEGFAMMLEDTQNQNGQAILRQLSNRYTYGRSLSVALAECGVFPQYLVETVHIGELSGRLEEVFTALALYYEREANLRQNLQSALRYPCIMLFMLAIVLGVLVAKVMPVFARVFEQLGSEMGAFPEGLLKVSNLLSGYSVVFAILFAVLVMVALYCIKTRKGSHLFTRFAQRFFLTKKIYRKAAEARLASGMALLLSSGIPTEESLARVYPMVDHLQLQEQIVTCIALLEAGTSFEKAISGAGIFQGLYARTIAVGIQTGHAEAAMQKLADHYTQEVDEQLYKNVSMVEPTLVAVFAVLVGGLLLSVMLPLMGILSAIG